MKAVGSLCSPYTTGNASVTPIYNTVADSSISYKLTTRKRPRESPLSFLSDNVSSILRQQTQEVDRLILDHTKKVRAELLDRRWWFWQLALNGVSKHLRVKDEEIERIRRLNSDLEERIRGLCTESQIWRELAQANQATAVVLQKNLDQVLAMQDRVNDDPESSCCGDNLEEVRGYDASGCALTVCRNCKEGEASVLLLPCRHLFLYSTCAPVLDSCPVCNCSKEFSVNVNCTYSTGL